MTAVAGSPGVNPAASVGFDIPKEALAPLLQFPYAIAAKRTGFAGFELSKEETDALVPMLDAVLKQYLPQVSGPHAALMMFGGSIAVITGIRYSMYLDFKAANTLLQNAKTDNGTFKKSSDYPIKGVSPELMPRESQIMPGVHV
jgi:hypothetical protein